MVGTRIVPLAAAAALVLSGCTTTPPGPLEPATANLQQVSSTAVPGVRHQVTFDLTPNALQLVTLEMEGGNRE